MPFALGSNCLNKKEKNQLFHNDIFWFSQSPDPTWLDRTSQMVCRTNQKCSNKIENIDLDSVFRTAVHVMFTQIGEHTQMSAAQGIKNMGKKP